MAVIQYLTKTKYWLIDRDETWYLCWKLDSETLKLAAIQPKWKGLQVHQLLGQLDNEQTKIEIKLVKLKKASV
jgi:hypothetical protein